jgi:solute carrier family 35 (adenosine 3'-phospho 5'-phosphosulfate transporter), member B3
VPVLVGGILIQGKRYGLLDLGAACLMSLGLAMFSLADRFIQYFATNRYRMISMLL